MLEDRDPEMSPNPERRPEGPALAGASETPWTETYAKGARVLRAARKPLDAVFGEPGSPTKLGRAMDATAEGLGVALMTHGAAATRLGGTRVLRKAGWQKGPFGWGVETRGDATLRPAAVFGAVREGRLGDVAYVHPDVAKAYPAMEDVPVKLVPAADWQRAVADARAVVREGSTGFSVRGGNGPIYIRGPMRGEDLGMFSERADRTLVHEMQHIAQDVDGVPGHAYARSNPGYATSAREVEARNSANRRWLTPEERIEMPRSMTQDVRPEDVHLDDKGGEKENYHRDFTNFLATDEVPETLFGYPVVQDERGYTESDLRFFRENPRAAGFYDTGDEEMEDVPQQAVKAGPAARGAYPGSLNNPGNVEKRKERRRGEVDSPHERWAKFATPQDGLREMADAIRQIAAVKLPGLHQDFTIRNFAELYAPRKNRKGLPENNTDKYIADISKYSGFGPDDELPRWSESDMAKFLRTVVRFESGHPHSAWFTDEEYAEAAKKLQEGAFD